MKIEKLASKAFSEFDAKNNDKCFNFDEVLNNLKKMLVRIGNQLLKKILRLIKFSIIDFTNIENSDLR